MKIEFISLYSYPSLTEKEILQEFDITNKNNSYCVSFNGCVYDLEKRNEKYFWSTGELTNKDFLHAIKLFDRKLKLKKLLK